MTITVRGQGCYEVLHGCAQDSTDSYVAVTGSELDARAWRSVAYTMDVITNGVKWQVFADNASAFGSEVIVQAEALVAADAQGTFTLANAPYSYYRIKIKSAVAQTPGSVSVYALMTG